MPHAGGIFLAHPALLGVGRRNFLHELKPVAQADLAQADALCGVNLLNPAHARLPVGFDVTSSFSLSISARTAAVSAPSGATFRPSPIWLPFHSIGSAGTRNGLPSAGTLFTRPPRRSTCGSAKRSSGRLIGEKEMLSASSLCARLAPAHC